MLLSTHVLFPIRCSFGYDPGVDADPKPNADIVKGFFWCGARGHPTQAALHDELRAVGHWMCRPLRWFSKPRRNLAGAGTRLWTATRVALARPRTPKYNAKFVCSVFLLALLWGGPCLP